VTEIVIATYNPDKAREIAAVMAKVPGRFSSLAERDDVAPVEETGSTFEENAVAKARGYAAALGLPCLADDSGLEVDALDGAPGVISARFAGTPCDDRANNGKLLDELRDVPESGRSARFVCVAALALPTGELHTARGECPGVILRELCGAGGFGYDPLFLPDGYEKTFGEMDAATKNRISHRAKAMEQMGDLICETAALASHKGCVRRVEVDFVSPEQQHIDEAARCINAGGVIAVRTDTLYGLMADATRAETVSAVAKLKGRPAGKPISVLAADTAMAERVAVMDERARDAAAKLWPGPVTLVLPAQPGLAPELLGLGNSVAVRVPAAELPRRVISAAGVPVTGTSANMAGQEGARTADEVAASFDASLFLVLDAGPVGETMPSTLLDIRMWPPVVLRKGAAIMQDIETALGCRLDRDS
jgi:XTP/dITP diphosphohydrolase